MRLTILQKKKSKLIKVEACACGDVACGIGNVLRNKGCAAAFLDLKVRYDKTSGSAKLLVISAHLAAHAHKANDRDADFHRSAESYSRRCLTNGGATICWIVWTAVCSPAI